jgi:hypothetical protein
MDSNHVPHIYADLELAEGWRIAKGIILYAFLIGVKEDPRSADLKLTFYLAMRGAVIQTKTLDDFIITHSEV